MRVFVDKMEALLRYWEERRDPFTGLYVWHDQLGTACLTRTNVLVNVVVEHQPVNPPYVSLHLERSA